MTARRALLLLVMALTAVAASACGAADASSGVTMTIRIHYSQFDPKSITVPAGLPVTYVIRNDDPIDHEWLIGDASFHARHRAGTEAVHGDRPDEVSLPALSTKTTRLTLAPGSYLFICHFPLHEDYGMIGLVTAR